AGPGGRAVRAARPGRAARGRARGATAGVRPGGGSAERGIAQPGDWLGAVDVVENRQQRQDGRAGTSGRAPAIRLSSRIEPEWLLDLFADRITDIDRRAFDPRTERIERTTGLAFGALALDARTEPAPPDDETARLL